MLYDNYKRKMQRVRDALNFIKRHRVVISIAFALVLIATSLLMSFKGTIHVSAETPSEVVYGEPIKPFASAFLSDVRYQYYDNGWSYQIPAKTGEFKVRAVAKRTFGTSYSDEYKLTILKKEIDVEVESHTIYGENPILSASLAYKDKITCSQFDFDYGEKLEAVPRLSAIKITNNSGINVTDNYILNLKKGVITYTPRDLEISFSAKNKVYDGTPLTADKFSANGLVEGDYIDVYDANSITQAGEITAKGKVNIYNKSGERINVLYNPIITGGMLKIDKRPISVRTSSAQKVYDGEYLSSNDFTATGSLAPGDTIGAGSLSTLYEVGEVDNKLNVFVHNSWGVDVTASYQIETQSGVLSIKKRNITLETPTVTFTYADYAFYTDYFDITSGSLTADGTIEVQTYTEITEVGKLTNDCTAKIIGIHGGTSYDATKNYNITYVLGTLTVNKRDIVVKTASRELVYSGAEQSYGQCTVDNLVELHEAKAYGNLPTVKNIGDQKQNIFLVKIFGKNNVDKTENYIIKYEYGIIKIVPIPITISTASAQFVYDGNSHSDNTFTVNGQLLTGDTASAVPPYSSIKSPNQVVENIFGVDIYRGGTKVNECYSISYEYGKLSMVPRPIKIKTATNSWVYDGKVHFDYACSVNGLLDGHSLKIVDTVAIQNVGTILNKNTYEVFYQSVNISVNYDISYDYGTLTVTRRDLFVETATNSWDYDDEYHSDNTITCTNLVSGHEATAESITSVRDVSQGKLDNHVSLTIVDQQNSRMEGNYNIIYNRGKLWITPIKVTLRPHSESKSYDGYPLYAKDYYLVEGKFYGDVSVYASYSGSITEIGTATSTITSARIYLDREVTKNYELSYLEGTLTVTKRYLYVIADDADKFYDGQPLTSKHYHTGGDGLLYGHVLTAQTTGQQTQIGKSYNTIVSGSVTITSSGKDVMDYYWVSLGSGTLHVWTREIYISTASDYKEYDGTPLRNGGYELSGQLLDNHEYRVEMNTQITFPGSTRNYPNVTVLENGIDVTVYYKIHETLGVLTILGGYGEGEIGGGIGGGGGGGGIGGGGGGKQEIVFEAVADVSGSVYLRQRSFGSYDFNRWIYAMPYQNSEIVNPFHLSAQSLIKALGHKNAVSIHPVLPAINFLSPYYLHETMLANALANDVGSISLEYNSYYASFLSYNFNEADFETGKFTNVNPVLEQAYYEYILGQYLHLPQSTLNEMLDIADSYGLKSGQKGLIQKVIDIVSNKVVYDLNHEQYMGDNAVYFFKEAKTGICSHYATAATALLRALGVPARYTVGYLANLEANVLTPIDSYNAHAWVEVYFKGVGWIQIEVTGGGFDGGIGGGGGGGGSGEAKEELKIKPIDVTKMFDGTPLYAQNIVTGADYFSTLLLEELLANGCYYSVTVTGSRTDYGVGASKIINFVLYDRYSNRINDDFNLTLHEGRIRITHQPIYIHLYEKQKFYDGTELSYNSNDYWVEGLPAGYKLTFKLEGTLKNAGQLTAEQLENLPFSVHDNTGRELFEAFSLVFVGKPLTIDRQIIEISSGSATKIFDGDPLTDDTVWLSMGKLAANETITATLNASITEIGTTLNKIQTLQIQTPDGTNTTKNYKIKLLHGTLTIT